MPSIEQNIGKWGEDSNWLKAGDEWSHAWGGASKQWHGSVLPRIQRFLPASTILEIAPGFGRWTQLLQPHCDRLIGVDLNANCIEACTRRFPGSPQLSFHLNDGKSLAMVPDSSIDFIFSLDSLVHAEADVIHAYLSQFNRILRPKGVAFIHHSNYGAYAVGGVVMALGRTRGLRHLVWRLRLGGIRPNYHWRAESMSAARFRASCLQCSLRCVEQEMINWGADFLNDCFSIAVRADSHGWPEETRVVENCRFMEEAVHIKSTQ